MVDKFIEALRKGEAINRLISSIGPDETAEYLEKGKKASVGEIRTWGGQDYIKVAENKWVPVNQFKLRLSTEVLYKDREGNWTAERQELHKKILDKYTKDVQKSKNPTVTLMMGAPSSGKGTIVRYLKDNNLLDGSLPTADPDEIKTVDLKDDFDKFSHFYVPTASRKVHEEGSELTKEIIKILSDKGADFVIDKVFSKEGALRKQIDELQSKGYKINLIMASLPKEIGFERALERARRSKRYIHKPSASAAYDEIDNTFDNIIKNPPKGLSSAIQFDTNTRIGEKPKIKIEKKYDKRTVSE